MCPSVRPAIRADADDDPVAGAQDHLCTDLNRAARRTQPDAGQHEAKDQANSQRRVHA